MKTKFFQKKSLEELGLKELDNKEIIAAKGGNATLGSLGNHIISFGTTVKHIWDNSSALGRGGEAFGTATFLLCLISGKGNPINGFLERGGWKAGAEDGGFRIQAQLKQQGYGIVRRTIYGLTRVPFKEVIPYLNKAYKRLKYGKKGFEMETLSNRSDSITRDLE